MLQAKMTQALRTYLLDTDHYRAPVVLLVVLALMLGIAWKFSHFNAVEGLIEKHNDPRQAIGTALMFALLPAYLLGVLKLFWQRTASALDDLNLNTAQLQHMRQQAVILSWWVWCLAAIGVVWGMYQNHKLIIDILHGLDYEFFDLTFVFCNTLLWSTIALVMGWRFNISTALSRIGRHLQYDYYRSARFNPIGRMATTDVLVIAGAMTFMPLQALDAQFRWFNYASGLIVGFSAMCLAFFLPLWGFHKSMQASKKMRLAALEKTLAHTPPDDVARLESLCAHIERVRGFGTWPLNLKLLGRTFGYVIIPPAAWVAAALVEQVIDAL